MARDKLGAAWPAAGLRLGGGAQQQRAEAGAAAGAAAAATDEAAAGAFYSIKGQFAGVSWHSARGGLQGEGDPVVWQAFSFHALSA